MRINQRTDAELTAALAEVERALLEDVKTSGRAKKSTVLRVLSNKGWCSPGSAGVEASFQSALTAKNLLGNDSPFRKLMLGQSITPPATSERAPEGRQEPVTAAATTTAVAPVQPGPGDFTVVNLKAVSLLQSKNGRCDIRFIGSDEGLVGEVDASFLRSNCNLLEFAI